MSIIFYHISNRFLPEEIQIKNNAWMYVVNYFGLVSIEEQKKIIQTFPQAVHKFKALIKLCFVHLCTVSTRPTTTTKIILIK